ncbi:hypothetical protein DFS34DRAFT_592142 [Phlyctochytrium arcticum]|nr:hypothetical protein DFS34DRAFT_592142 [Phlyctochytrium arcticum]
MFCELCNRSFPHSRALDQHIADSQVHAALYDCWPCRPNFDCYEDLQSHNEDVHSSLINPCPFCSKSFPSGPSALLMHLESGGVCATRQGLTRDRIATFVGRADKKGLLTFKGPESVNQIVEGKEEEKEEYEESIDEDVIELERLECKQCPERGQFQDIAALLRHQSSAAHDPIRYHCPTRIGLAQQLTGAPSTDDDTQSSELESVDSWDEKTFALGNDGTVSESVAASEHDEMIQGEHARGFRTLSGLTQHLERGACNDGMQTFQEALKCVTQEMGKMGIALRIES